MKEYTVQISDKGTIRWYQNGMLHREDGPAVEYSDGTKEWYHNDKLHRTDGPAIEWENGSKYWYLNGKRHRTDGPAVEYADGSKEWWVDGVMYTEKEFNKKTQVTELTVADIERILGYSVKIVKG